MAPSAGHQVANEPAATDIAEEVITCVMEAKTQVPESASGSGTESGGGPSAATPATVMDSPREQEVIFGTDRCTGGEAC